jgi:hypothetical protein
MFIQVSNLTKIYSETSGQKAIVNISFKIDKALTGADMQHCFGVIAYLRL